ncbi:stage II sporulation protein R [uncultured Clostridium sp.]|uniref:stage II sporulation protein R n=1 Tax=uncultured Clostridium sp. TaxID=59620 RepID=UPI0025E66B7E|nr:stage II sporulation protein R [uncultured Clostridium sp.]
MKKFFGVNMKVILLLIIISILSFNIFYGCTTITVDKVCVNNLDAKTLNYDDVKDSLIRFHVIANSDSDEDQTLKLKVKNKVIEYLYPYLSESKSVDNSREIIKSNMDKVKMIAEDVIKREGYNYDVNLELSRENFPDKSYGNIVLPQGNYEAFRIIIGKGDGRNWWCVMFPPLCFVDESKAEVEYDKVEEDIKNQQNHEEQNLENDDKNSDDNSEDNNDDNVKIKFKLAEVIQRLFE